ncbi:hypothetical protein CpB0021 [Chlamydia pneumoniae TW-183]|uniref:Lipoprotein n=3 Tax=Chlamydia pneumoniae TaxID=83558 RepID=A0ABM5LBX1_CHLPN|nr:hypothetical protein CP_0758 [Chlamydia pneumoniae AR39]AAP97954.1 hypothetical protein CpB0021 [Chlamydia pneumoniae TW-183]ACZ32990.1 putative lipoprotein [Chlamydia pneumoniae LPCoLN]ETR79886.1 hypothetical protein X556_0788 [Chlamydia pneumoniae B21]CRI35373.1 Putative lipoprotein [Chlamydia pneumoniae]
MRLLLSCPMLFIAACASFFGFQEEMQGRNIQSLDANASSLGELFSISTKGVSCLELHREIAR